MIITCWPGSTTGETERGVNGIKSTEEFVTFEIVYSASLNGAEIAKETLTVVSPLTAADWSDSGKKILYEDKDHLYSVRYKYINDTIQFSLESSFKD